MFSSYRVIELVRKAISTEYLKASDTDVAKAIGISRASVSAYKTGREVMSHETLGRANVLLKLPEAEIAGIGFDLLLESARTDNERAIYKSMRDMARHVRHWAKTHTASILLVALGLFSAPRGASATVFEVGSAGIVKPPVDTLCATRRRWARRLAKILGCLKSQCAAPLPPPWARICSVGLALSRSPA